MAPGLPLVTAPSSALIYSGRHIGRKQSFALTDVARGKRATNQNPGNPFVIFTMCAHDPLMEPLAAGFLFCLVRAHRKFKCRDFARPRTRLIS